MNNQTPFLKYNEFTKSIDAPKTGFSKAFDFSPWGGLEGFLEASKAGMTGYNNKGSQYRAFVPDVFRAVDMTAVAVSSLPFDIMDGGKVIDTSTDWKNKLGGIPNPKRLFYDIASSLCGGLAYVIPEGTDDVTVNMKYVPSGTVQYNFDTNGINQFMYTSQFGGSQIYTPDEIIHIFLPDSDIEGQPAKAHPLGVAMSSAWRIMAMDNTINVQSERGFIPPTLLMAEGLIASEVARTETWFNRWVKNPLKEIYKVINAKTIQIQKVGSGMDELKTVFMELKADARIEIGQAFGIPAGIFLPDKAFASEMDVLFRQWYSTSIFVTIYQTIAETLTEQYFEPRFGATMQYKPETLKVFQEDETKRSAAFRDYISADLRPSLIGEMLGLDLPQGKKYTDLDEFYDKRLAGANTEKPVNPLGNPAMPVDDTTPSKQSPAPIKAIVLLPEEMEDYLLWRQKAIAWGRKGKSAVDWENKNLRETITESIRLKLRSATNEAEIKKAFELDEMENIQQENHEIKSLVDSINLAVEQPKQQPIQVLVDNRNYKVPGLTDAFLKSVFGKD